MSQALLKDPLDHVPLSPFPPGCASKFQLNYMLASGGYGSVYLATQRRLARSVAIKLLHVDIVKESDELNRFINEARLTASLNHPNIVVVIDFDVEDEGPWIAYEYLPGRSLRDMLRGGALPQEQALDIAGQIAAALSEAHSKNILHRDIKPENVLEAEPGHWKVTDFGIAKSIGGVALTRTGRIPGTPIYTSPEQIQGASATTQSDIYVLGLVLFELVTGRTPFSDMSLASVLRHHVHSDVVKPSTYNPAVHPAVDDIVLKAMARDPGKRFASAAAMRQAMEIAASDVASGTRRVSRLSARSASASRSRRMLQSSGRRVSVQRKPQPSFPTRMMGSMVQWASGVSFAKALVLLMLMPVLAFCLTFPRAGQPDEATPVRRATSQPRERSIEARGLRETLRVQLHDASVRLLRRFQLMTRFALALNPLSTETASDTTRLVARLVQDQEADQAHVKQITGSFDALSSNIIRTTDADLWVRVQVSHYLFNSWWTVQSLKHMHSLSRMADKEGRLSNTYWSIFQNTTTAMGDEGVRLLRRHLQASLEALRRSTTHPENAERGLVDYLEAIPVMAQGCVRSNWSEPYRDAISMLLDEYKANLSRLVPQGNRLAQAVGAEWDWADQDRTSAGAKAALQDYLQGLQQLAPIYPESREKLSDLAESVRQTWCPRS